MEDDAQVPSAELEKSLANIEEFLRESVQRFEPEPMKASGPGRPRILPSLCLWVGVLVCVLRRCSHQSDLWRLLAKDGLWSYPHFPISDQAVYDRLDTNDNTLERLFDHVSAILRQRITTSALTLAPWASGVYALDSSTLDQVKKWLPALRPVKKGATDLLPGRLQGLFDLRLQQWVRVLSHDNPLQNDLTFCRSLIDGLERGSLLLFDLGHFAFKWFDDLTDGGQWWVTRLRPKVTYQTIHVLYSGKDTLDAIVWLGKYKADRAAHAVRLIQFTVKNTTYTYLTNVLDPHKLSLRDIAGLYSRRWDIENAFRLIKQYLKLHILWSSKPQVVWHQVWAVLLVSQIMMGLRMEIAARAQADVFEVSMELLVRYAPYYSSQGRDPIEEFAHDGRRVGFIRPSRRTINQAPLIDIAHYIPPPPGLQLKRKPRYAREISKSKNGTVK